MTEEKCCSLSATVVRVASLWLLAGALFKLFAGSPNDLPPMVKEFFLGPDMTFKSAIAVELCVVMTVLLRPRLGWFFLAGTYAVFIAVLAPLVASGEESCGCFGSSVTIPPIVMMGLDALMLLAILFTKPWSQIAKSESKPWILVPLCAAGIASPFLKIQSAPVGPTIGDEGVPDTSEMDYAILDDKLWSGQMIDQIDMAGYLPDLTNLAIPPTCRIVIYRSQCEHCQAHLEELAQEMPDAARPIVLLYVPEASDTFENELTQIKPEAAMVLELPMLPRGYVITTPLDLMVDDYVVTSVNAIEE